LLLFVVVVAVAVVVMFCDGTKTKPKKQKKNKQTNLASGHDFLASVSASTGSHLLKKKVVI